MRPFVLICCLSLAVSACSSLPSVPTPDFDLPNRFDPREDDFVAQHPFPIPANVERLIGPEDCQGAQLAARSFELPEYPARAYSNGLQGWVVVRFDVRDDGRTRRVRTAEDVPAGHFDGVAEHAVRNWRFRELPEGQELRNCVVLFEFRTGRVSIR